MALIISFHTYFIKTTHFTHSTAYFIQRPIITGASWYKELSAMTNGISTLFQSSCKSARLVEAATLARGSMASREIFDSIACCCSASSVVDEEMEEVYRKYKKERDEMLF